MKKLFSFFLFLFLIQFNLNCQAVEVTSPFGWRIHPIAGVERFHTGADLGYAMGDLAPAMLPGKVAFAGVWGGYGNCIILEHINGDHTLYGHLNSIYVKEGQYVGLHQAIGAVGSTGYSTGPHLHLEWWHNGEYVNPLPLFEMPPEMAYAYAPVNVAPTPTYNAPIQATMNPEGMGVFSSDDMVALNDMNAMDGFGFGFNLDEKKKAEKAEKMKKEKQRKMEKKALPMDYTKEQLEQMKIAVKTEAIEEAKRQLKKEEEAKKERMFFRFGFD